MGVVRHMFEEYREAEGARREVIRDGLREAVEGAAHGRMSLMVCGSRYYDSTRPMVHQALNLLPIKPRVLMHGAAPGVDLSAGDWAESAGVPVVTFPADWTRYGKGGGPIRNQHMRHLADAVVAVWDGRREGCGTWGTVSKLRDEKVWCAWQIAQTDDYRVIFGVRWSRLGPQI